MRAVHSLLWIPLVVTCQGPGALAGEPFRFNPFTTGDQRAAWVAATRNPGVVAVWTNDLNASSVEVYGTLSPDWVFGDGLESGGLSGWWFALP